MQQENTGPVALDVGMLSNALFLAPTLVLATDSEDGADCYVLALHWLMFVVGVRIRLRTRTPR